LEFEPSSTCQAARPGTPVPQVVELGSAPPVRGTRPRNCVLVGLTISSEEIAPLHKTEFLREGQANVSLFLDTGLSILALPLANTDLSNSIDGFRPVSRLESQADRAHPTRMDLSQLAFLPLRRSLSLLPGCSWATSYS